MTEDEAREFIAAEVRRQMTAAGKVLVVPAAEVVRREYQQRAVERLLAKLDELGPDEQEAYRYLMSRDVFVTVQDLSRVISGYVGGAAQIKWGKATKNLVAAGVVQKGGSGGSGFKPAAREWIAKELAPHEPKDEEIEAVYQAVLGRLVGGAG